MHEETNASWGLNMKGTAEPTSLSPDDSSLSSASLGLTEKISNKYMTFPLAIRLLTKVFLVLLIPLSYSLYPGGFRLFFPLAYVSEEQMFIYTDPILPIGVFVLLVPSLWIAYTREKHPQSEITNRRALLALILTSAIAMLFPSLRYIPIMGPVWQTIVPDIDFWPGMPCLGYSFFPNLASVVMIAFVVIPQILQWSENLPTKNTPLQTVSSQPLSIRRLVYLVILLLLFFPYVGSITQYVLPQHTMVVVSSVCLSFSNVGASIFRCSIQGVWIYPTALIDAFPHLLFAYRFIRYFAGLETRRRTVRMGVLSIAWSFLLNQLMSSLLSPSMVGPILPVSFPVPLFFLVGLIAMYHPSKIDFLFTEKTPIGRRTRSKEKVEVSEDEEMTVPLMYLLKSKIKESRFNIWRDEHKENEIDRTAD